jgi:DNA-directed RNA polymerase specialized sigma24 family protein
MRRDLPAGTMAAERNAASFADRLERFFRQNYTQLIRAHLRLGTVEEVQDALQEAMMRIYARFGDGQEPEPDNLPGFVHVAIRNVLIDRFRRPLAVDLSEVDREEEAAVADGVNPAMSLPRQDDVLAWKQLLKVIFDRLPAKWVEVASMAMSGASPEEIGEAFEQNGYVLRRYARELVCKILHELARKDDPLAAAFARGFCG